MANMANAKKKYVWLGVAGAALATLLLYFSIFWPPVPRGWVQGAVGKRDVYRQDKLTDKDIGVAGTVNVTVDDIRKFQQSPEFKSLAGNAQFNQLVANAQFQKLFTEGHIAQFPHLLSSGTGPKPFIKHLAEFQQLLKSEPAFRQFQKNAQFALLIDMPVFRHAVTSSQFVTLAAQSQLATLVGNAAQQQVVIAPTNRPFIN